VKQAIREHIARTRIRPWSALTDREHTLEIERARKVPAIPLWKLCQQARRLGLIVTEPENGKAGQNGGDENRMV
jgi:hypothetical protein